MLLGGAAADYYYKNLFGKIEWGGGGGFVGSNSLLGPKEYIPKPSRGPKSLQEMILWLKNNIHDANKEVGGIFVQRGSRFFVIHNFDSSNVTDDSITLNFSEIGSNDKILAHTILISEMIASVLKTLLHYLKWLYIFYNRNRQTIVFRKNRRMSWLLLIINIRLLQIITGTISSLYGICLE